MNLEDYCNEGQSRCKKCGLLLGSASWNKEKDKKILAMMAKAIIEGKDDSNLFMLYKSKKKLFDGECPFHS